MRLCKKAKEIDNLVGKVFIHFPLYHTIKAGTTMIDTVQLL